MATRLNEPPEKQIVLPADAKEEEDNVRSARNWGRKQLRLLGVNFQKKRRFDLNKHILKVNESDWSPELRARIAERKDLN
jgi:hypothetical protein